MPVQKSLYWNDFFFFYEQEKASNLMILEILTLPLFSIFA